MLQWSNTLNTLLALHVGLKLWYRVDIVYKIINIVPYITELTTAMALWCFADITIVKTKAVILSPMPIPWDIALINSSDSEYLGIGIYNLFLFEFDELSIIESPFDFLFIKYII